jgi:hypothetical protein
MPALAIAVLSFVAALASAIVGLALARTLPESHTQGGSRVILVGIAALTGLMLAATLAQSISSACAFTQMEKSAIRRLAAEALEFDLAARRLGPQAAQARRLISAELAMVEAEMRGAARAGAGAPGAVAADITAMNAALDGLKPADDMGKRALAEAEQRYGAVGEARLMLALPPADPASWPVVLAALAWACIAFCGLGALSRANATTLAALALGGAAVASAIWLSIELSQPHSGLIRLSPTPIEQILVEIGQ